MNNKLNQIEHLKNQLAQYRPLSMAEVQRLREEFVIESGYNSNVRSVFENFGEIQ